MDYTFGPVPSRRLGKSLGINNIPYKICTYSCIYCQLGRTKNLTIEKKNFYKVKEILDGLKKRIVEIQKIKENIDYICFVPDGEPTLDLNLLEEVEQLQRFKFPKGIITNSSLLFDKNVRNALLKFDWVSLKIDTVEDNIWRKINRPHKKLNLQDILEGIIKFTRNFKGKLVTETMVLKNFNDGLKSAEKTAEFIKKINPLISYISIPTRPPS